MFVCFFNVWGEKEPGVYPGVNDIMIIIINSSIRETAKANWDVSPDYVRKLNHQWIEVTILGKKNSTVVIIIRLKQKDHS